MIDLFLNKQLASSVSETPWMLVKPVCENKIAHEQLTVLQDNSTSGCFAIDRIIIDNI